MAVVHRTTMSPTKMELLTEWLPAQPWYRGGPKPELAKAGGFRLDDPAGEVGIEFMIVTEVSAGEPVAYHLPLTYRGAPLDGADAALIGTSEHGVLGTRWIYDGVHDPVLLAQLTALLRGEVQAQAQGESDTPDPSVQVHVTGSGTPVAHRVLPHSGVEAALGTVTVGWELPDGTHVEGVVASA
ncbi:hypothetical protein ABIA32_002038 [Streptacidiphilus sp. MAP12-20]|uniref:maltokinase N-terminal cap-like domain-containing protein n=1 Tax=Streptacidiphilus sp. MAP12-20 TaxID=3156299 RepID=UPI003519124E